ncbi:tRNA pseudouridine synthase D [Sinobacterium norvegicum]|uniref:tRNA pseudouridine synthase D n=1 Tax=Sinobacterium norvegicum TaxID=1641715 RepID=A0ABN8EE24_9GAMM|nr:tRNA pseudouridine(13) synthase TruD [Sinobacterium norvegicum]CAH0990689.1 tRNA pseudouridine synthase D [Sinobacterium norvegicum]
MDNPLIDFSQAFEFAYGGPSINGDFKSTFEDFIVEEELGYELSGEGEHLYLYIQKRNQNTGFLQQRLAEYFSVPEKQVSYCGLKDRHAVTRQWFGIHLPGKYDVDLSHFADDDTAILKARRHNKKLRIGAHQCNRFIIRLRNISGDLVRLEQQLSTIANCGVPNYFGAQRFGRDRGNLPLAVDLFAGKKLKRRLRSLAISSARSYLFNLVLSERVRLNNWRQWQDGDVASLAGSNSFFVPERLDDTLLARLDSHDVELSAPLWGRGSNPASGKVAEWEQAVVAPYGLLTAGLEKIGLEQQRRAMTMVAQQLTWSIEGQDLTLSFSLESGCFATALIRELLVSAKPL